MRCMENTKRRSIFERQEVIVGYLPKRALSLTIEWAIGHRAELMEDWNLCQAKQQPRKIQPLE